MLKKILWSALLAVLFIPYAQAQYSGSSKARSIHVGLQANPLLRQVLSFGGAPEVNNPFLLKVGIRNNATQRELMFGLGYTYELERLDEGLKTSNSALNFRVGYAQKVDLGKRFEAGYGFDAVLNLNNLKSQNGQSFGFLDSLYTEITTDNLSYGFGPQLTFGYYITDKIRIGTEATLYYMVGTREEKVHTERTVPFPTPETVITQESRKDRTESADLQIPVALFLTIIF